MRPLVLLVSAVAIPLLSACGDEPLRVGSKDFTEQHIIGEMIAQLAEDEGIAVTRGIPYGDSDVNLEGLKQGRLDVYPEYTGTGLSLLGQPPIRQPDEAYARVSKLYEPLDLIWRQRMGFSNNYVLVMRRDRAERLAVNTISDLAEIDGGVRFATNEQFLERPRDGMTPMLRRYGLTRAGTVVENSADKRYAALLDGRADVAVGFSTDGHIAEFDLRVLADDKDFFPIYQAAPLVRQQALDQYPALDRALAKLAGTLDRETMRRLNKAVALDGRDYRKVAHNFLAEEGLIAAPKRASQVEELTLAAGPLDQLTGSAGDALQATRASFEGRGVELHRSATPMGALERGEARLALVGAEAFFKIKDSTPAQTRAAVAAARVGFRYVHILASRESGIMRLQDMESLGVPAENGPSHHAARMILAGLGLRDRIEIRTYGGQSLDSAANQVAAGNADGLLALASEGHHRLTRLMETGAFRLVPLAQWNQGNNVVRFPFFRLATLPAGTYDDMAEPIETIGAQLVLAGPSPKQQPVGDAGPGTGAPSDVPKPVSAKAVASLNDALAGEVKLDPTLPRGAGLAPELPELTTSINPSAAVSVTNLVIILVLVYLFYLFLREAKREHD